MKKMEKQTFQFKLSNWHYKINIDGEWVNCGMIESKGYPALALAPQIAEIQTVLPGYTYTTSRDSLWHIFAPHTTDDGSGDEVEFSMDLNSPGKRGNIDSCSCEQDSKADNLSTTDWVIQVSITFKIYQGTTYYLPFKSTEWEICQAATGPGPITPPPIKIINNLNNYYAYYSYQEGSDAQNIFAEHQGTNHLGDGESFTVYLYAELEIVTEHWKIGPSLADQCPRAEGFRIGQYYIKDDNGNWLTAGCVQHGYHSGDPFDWVNPPSDDYLTDNCPVYGLSLQGDQYNVACPIFWSQSGIALSGMNEDFSVTMTKIKTK